MLTAVNIIILVLCLSVFSIISEARLSIDVYAKSNSMIFYLFGIKVIQIDLGFAGGKDEPIKLELKNKDKTIAALELDKLDMNTARDAFKQALPNPFYNLDIIELDAYAEYGSENAFFTAMFTALLRNLMGGALLYVLSTQNVRITSRVKPNFDAKTIVLKLSGIFSITLADIIFGIIFGKKGEKENDSGK